MTDREKVIKGLDSCAKWMKDNDGDACDNCPYHSSHFSYDDNDCYAALYHDTIALLKEPETEWEHLWDTPDGTYKGRCKKCGFTHIFIEAHDTQYAFCPSCGRKVK